MKARPTRSVVRVWRSRSGGVTPSAAPDYSGSLANINSGISQLAAAGAAPVYVSAYFGNDNFGTVVANANANNAFLAGGR